MGSMVREAKAVVIIVRARRKPMALTPLKTERTRSMNPEATTKELKRMATPEVLMLGLTAPVKFPSFTSLMYLWMKCMA